MKKLLSILAVGAAMMMTSCNNEDITIDTVASTHQVTININPKTGYENFGISNSITNLLRDQIYELKTTTLLYDQNNKLVDKKINDQYNLNTFSVNFDDVIEGTYTVISITHIQDDDPDYIKWTIEDIDNLNTVKIKQDRSNIIYWYDSILMTTEQITVNDKAVLNIAPKGIGSIINVDYLYFNDKESIYEYVGFGTTDQFDYYSLDPSIPEENRYAYDLNESGVFNLLGFTVPDEERCGFDIFVLDKNLTYNIYWNKPQNDFGTWTSYSNMKRTVQLNTGKVYYCGACYVSEDTPFKTYFTDSYSDFEKWVSSMDKPATTITTLVPEVSTNWGGTVKSVQSQMKGWNLTYGSDGYAVEAGNMYLIGYAGKDHVDNIFYAFKSATTGLYNAEIVYKDDAVTINQIKNEIDKNYELIVEDDGSYLFVNDAWTTVVIVGLMQGQVCVDFYDADYLLSDSSPSKIQAPKPIVTKTKIDKPAKVNTNSLNPKYQIKLQDNIKLSSYKTID